MQNTTVPCKISLVQDTVLVISKKKVLVQGKNETGVDTLVILEYLSEKNPFTDDMSLKNIETGVEAEPDVSVDKAESIRNITFELMKGEIILSYSSKKSNQSITLAAKPKSKSDSDFLCTDIDPQLMFQRLTTAAIVYLKTNTS